MMRGSVIGHGIGLSDTTRCHYTLEGSFDWNRGDVVFVRRDGIGNSSSSSSSSSSSGRGSSSSSMVRRKRESETYIGQMIGKEIFSNYFCLISLADSFLSENRTFLTHSFLILFNIV